MTDREGREIYQREPRQPAGLGSRPELGPYRWLGYDGGVITRRQWRGPRSRRLGRIAIGRPRRRTAASMTAGPVASITAGTATARRASSVATTYDASNHERHAQWFADQLGQQRLASEPHDRYERRPIRRHIAGQWHASTGCNRQSASQPHGRRHAARRRRRAARSPAPVRTIGATAAGARSRREHARRAAGTQPSSRFA